MRLEEGQGPLGTRTLYIISDSRSGSTLLQHLLALQEGVLALGEVRRLEHSLGTGRPCACGRPIERCPFWTRVVERVGTPLSRLSVAPDLPAWRRRVDQAAGWTALKLGVDGLARRIQPENQRTAVENSLNIYRAVAVLTGARVIVDSSKVPSYFLSLRLRAAELVRPVFLVRDGRAVTWSKMRRRPDLDAGLLARQWLNVSRMMLALQQVVPEDEGRLVRYEELCADPIGEVGGILAPVGLRAETADLGLLPDERHDLGGSPRFAPQAPGAGSIELDERWRHEMPKEALRVFEKVAGPMNRRLGYV